jgi:hypothetical protein
MTPMVSCARGMLADALKLVASRPPLTHHSQDTAFMAHGMLADALKLHATARSRGCLLKK